MPATEHVVNASKLQSNLGLTPMSPDDSTARSEFEAIVVEELSALLGGVDEHPSSSDELCTSPVPATRHRSTTTAGKRKRSFGSDDDDDKEPHTRIRTYTARKKEIEALMAELPALEAYVDYLKHQAAKISNQTNSTQKQQLVNSCLRDTAHRQQFALARIHSALSDFTSRQEKLIPFDKFIHLRKDRRLRLQTLLNLKPRMLRDARRFMRERTAFMDLSVPSSEQSCFVSPLGDYCALKFVVMPLEGDFSARQVFDSLKFYLFNMEIMISEATGDLTLCEEEESDNQAVSQHRFLRSTPSGFQVESNDVIFCHFDEHNEEFGDGREYGIIVIDCVGKDDLHPYSPDKKLRQDLTSILTVQTYKHKVPCAQNPKKLQIKTQVVMARSNFFKLHHTSLPLSKIEMQETIDRLACRGNLLFNAVRASVSSSGEPDL
ncbi:hypothetical protein JG687_00001159 [Phytophthora cactorum]|uniref:Uncharacterized protein n=1 Tax=Phytophthora cactorum TaxID=29920 RepID=A0A329RS09_9STRA|nr:hypothetical protein Pcac1_g13534 [Phytophthora cactorum]KAG2840857.1 hypothetical protein PC112_g3571 [Phytophthora cactorum]KAG2842659.1 hypothetical protein PC111_g2667 [Phytophthora cactorum]KAG2867326.1 hypothetical protein PC113_g2053 [Phytophthora cactorum]KAG2924868.1 hypothetical protein PC114_g4314 [Phytophthora cactorum]